MADKTYLGDGVYVEYDGYAFILTTEGGVEATVNNKIYLEPLVYITLIDYIKRLSGLIGE